MEIAIYTSRDSIRALRSATGEWCRTEWEKPSKEGRGCLPPRRRATKLATVTIVSELDLRAAYDYLNTC
ncbi:hypothetical protein J6590_057244 [Homalodisca vitripennis]|nr:hypothetical protein J6590_057244 [Homalodisca vitripennis]